jgi:hypothetical protein
MFDIIYIEKIYYGQLHLILRIDGPSIYPTTSPTHQQLIAIHQYLLTYHTVQ